VARYASNGAISPSTIETCYAAGAGVEPANLSRPRLLCHNRVQKIASYRHDRRRSYEISRNACLSGILLCLALSGTAFAKDNSSYTQVGRNINIGPDQQVGELTCFGCSIRVRGQVSGDITTFGGSITLENQAQVAGDVTSFGGDLRLDQGVRVAGGATVFGGQIRRDPQATVAGDVTSFGGHGWALLILLTPLVGVGLFVALVIWLIQRVRRPSVPVRAG